MTDTLRRLVGPRLLTTTATTIYTALTGTTATIRGIHVASESGAQASFTLSIGVLAVGTAFYRDVAVATGDAFDWTGTLVLAAGDVLQASASTPNALTLTISGVETT